MRLRGEVNIRITSSREMQELNRRFRKKNKPTDVLSFPSGLPKLAGDIAISAEIAAANAAELGHSTETELKILILHGLLHLAGYDHETDDGEMQAREAELRQHLKLPVGLIERAAWQVGSTAPKAQQSAPSPLQARRQPEMSLPLAILLLVLMALLALVSYVDRLYAEMGKFLAREFQENIEAYEERVEPAAACEPRTRRAVHGRADATLHGQHRRPHWLCAVHGEALGGAGPGAGCGQPDLHHRHLPPAAAVCFLRAHPGRVAGGMGRRCCAC